MDAAMICPHRLRQYSIRGRGTSKTVASALGAGFPADPLKDSYPTPQYWLKSDIAQSERVELRME
jgi:hypothetical protein